MKKKTVKETSPTSPKPQWQGPGDRNNMSGSGRPAGTHFRWTTPEEWVEEFYRNNARLSNFNVSEHTTKISEYINIDLLKKMVITYRIMLDAQSEKYSGNINWMRREIKKIYTGLNGLSKEGWLNPSDRKEIKEQISQKIFRHSRNGLQFIRNQERGKSNGNPQDIAFNSLAYWLCQYLKKETGKPQYKLVLNFLEENTPVNEKEVTVDEENFPRRVQRIKPDVLNGQYTSLRNAAMDTFILSRKDIIDSGESAYIANLLIPPFESFLQ